MILQLSLLSTFTSTSTSPFFPPISFSPAFLPIYRSIAVRTPVRAKSSSAITAQSSCLSESAIDSYWLWLEKEKVVPASSSSPIVKPGVVPEGIGLVAQRDVARNEVVLEVPKRLWINLDTVAASEIGPVCQGLKPWISISLFILREKGRGSDSMWKPYFDVLPDVTDSTLFWSEEELLEIKGTQLLNTTLGVKEYVKSEFLKIEEEIILPNKRLFPSTISLTDFIWAFGILRSRAFPRLRGENLALIPLADLINHNSRINNEDISWEIKGKGLFSKELIFSLRSPVSIKAGDQVLIQYDLEKSNSEFALDYGFVEPKSDRNTYTLTLGISESDSFYEDKLDIAETNGLGETAYFDIVLGQSLPAQLIPYLRLVALGGSDAFLLESIFRNSVWGHLELPVSRPNEELICKVIREACGSALSSYNTTIEEDERLVQQGNLCPRSELAVHIRSGEKKVLQQIDKIFQDREEELDVLEYYQERRLKDLGLVGEQGDIIFWE